MCPKRAFRAHDVPATSGLMREPSGPAGVIATQARACARARDGLDPVCGEGLETVPGYRANARF